MINALISSKVRSGLTLSPFDKKIYISNHGAKGGDWFGEVKKGENYGWKILGWGGKNYSGARCALILAIQLTYL